MWGAWLLCACRGDMRSLDTRSFDIYRDFLSCSSVQLKFENVHRGINHDSVLLDGKWYPSPVRDPVWCVWTNKMSRMKPMVHWFFAKCDMNVANGARQYRWIFFAFLPANHLNELYVSAFWLRCLLWERHGVPIWCLKCFYGLYVVSPLLKRKARWISPLSPFTSRVWWIVLVLLWNVLDAEIAYFSCLRKK